MSTPEYMSKYMRRLRLSRRMVHTGKATCCGECWRTRNREHMRKVRDEMVIEVKRTIVRKVMIAGPDGEKKPVMLYIQPDGLLVFRGYRARRRYGISIAETMARAVKIGPIDGILAGLLDVRSKPKGRKKNVLRDSEIPVDLAGRLAPDKAE